VSRLPVENEGRRMTHLMEQRLDEHARLSDVLPQQNASSAPSGGGDFQFAFAVRGHAALPNDWRYQTAVEDGVIEHIKQDFGQCNFAVIEIFLPIGHRERMTHVDRGPR